MIKFRGKRIDNGEWVEGDYLSERKDRPTECPCFQNCELAYRWECEDCKDKLDCELFGQSDGCWKSKKQE